MQRWPRRERERFARAVEDPSSPEGDEFRHELSLVAELRGLGAAQSLGASRERIAMLIKAEQVAEPEPVVRTGGLRPVLVGGVLGLLALGGVGVALSQNALPGDSLYEVKLAQEWAAIGLTFDEEARAGKQLAYAADRISELLALNGEAEFHSEAEFHRAFADFEEATRQGTLTLTGVATRSSGRQLTTLSDWAAAQSSRLAELRSLVPPGAGPAHDNAVTLVTRVGQRATALAGRLGCYRITSGQQDDLGALPASGECATSPAQPPIVDESGKTPETGHDSRVRYEQGTPAADPRPIRATPVAVPDFSATAPIPAPLPAPVNRPRLATPPVAPPELLRIPSLLPGLPEVKVGW